MTRGDRAGGLRAALAIGLSLGFTIAVNAVDIPAAAVPAAQAAASMTRAPEDPPPALDGKPVHAARWDRLVQRNLAPNLSLPETLLESRLVRWSQLPIGERVGRWALLFATRGDNSYLFGLQPGGYVADSVLVNDYKLDCVSLFYRCTELARAGSPRGALAVALETRFKGGDPEHVVLTSGAVDYHEKSHLDFSEDIVSSGTWGREVTAQVGDAIPDPAGTSRYAPKSSVYIPKARLHADRLQEGDLVYFVLDEHTEHGRKLRQQVGTAIGHQAIVHIENGIVYTIHAAAKPLSGVYEGNRVVRVPLLTYLKRIENFKGIRVTRLANEPEGRQSAVPAALRTHSVPGRLARIIR